MTMRILIAEDDQTCSLILSSMLRSYGALTVVADGEAAIRAFTAGLVQQQPYDLICLDLLMPKLDGQSALCCIRAIEHAFGRTGGSGVKILITTGVNTPEALFAAFRSQCECYLVKPLEREQLRAQLAGLGFART
jgi:two-component system, chemotaxis family, chemotaxis protein CheY